MATIYKRGRMWWLAYTFAGKRIQKSIGPAKQIAEFAKKDIEVRIAKKKASLPIEYKLSDWKQEFFAYIEAHLRPRTVQRYKESLTWFFQFLDDLPHVSFYLSDITSQMIEGFKLHRLKKVSPTSTTK